MRKAERIKASLDGVDPMDEMEMPPDVDSD